MRSPPPPRGAIQRSRLAQTREQLSEHASIIIVAISSSDSTCAASSLSPWENSFVSSHICWTDRQRSTTGWLSRTRDFLSFSLSFFFASHICRLINNLHLTARLLPYLTKCHAISAEFVCTIRKYAARRVWATRRRLIMIIIITIFYLWLSPWRRRQCLLAMFNFPRTSPRPGRVFSAVTFCHLPVLRVHGQPVPVPDGCFFYYLYEKLAS